MHPFLEPEWHDSLPSTNSVLAARLRTTPDVVPGTVLAAREQTAGRGRQERTWVAGAGRNLTFSFSLHTPAVFPRLASLPMATALGIAEELESLGIPVQTKWPNDLLVADRKICGILSECIATEPQTGSDVVVGVGLNVNMSAEEAERIDQPATSILLETGQAQEPDALLPRLLGRLRGWLEAWEAGGFPALSEAWTARCKRIGKPVTVREGNRSISGIVEGFGSCGEMRLRLESGEIRAMWSGDVGDGGGDPLPGNDETGQAGLS